MVEPIAAGSARMVPPVIFAEPVGSILIVKLDHIGDFFISAPAMRRLREAFPEARITLACGPWNRQLAIGLGIFDEVVPFDFFPEQTRNLRQIKDDRHRVALLHRRFGALFPGPYDLAIDMRYDTDTRRLLTMVDARRRAGVADSGEFAFLDLALPSDRPRATPPHREGEVRQFDIGFSDTGERVWVDAARRDLALRFEIDRPMSPLSLDLSNDPRLLGVALQRARVTRTLPNAVGWYAADLPIWAATPIAGRNPVYGLDQIIPFESADDGGRLLESGFAEPEFFGAWTIGPVAEFKLPLLIGLNRDLRLCLKLEGYVPPTGKPQSFTLWAGTTQLARAMIARDRAIGTLIVPIPTDVIDSSPASVTSAPFMVELGKAVVRLRVETAGQRDLSGRSSVTVEIINDVDRILARRILSGDDLALLGANDIDFVQDDPGSPVRVRVTVNGVPFGLGFHIGGIQVTSTTQRYAPRVHVLDWGGGIIDMVVRHFRPARDLIGLPHEPLPADLDERLAADRMRGRDIILVATGANKDVTKWPIAYYDRLVGLLLQRRDCAIYFIGAAREFAEAQAIIDRAGPTDRLVNTCGSTTLLQLKSLLDHADLFIGGSTGTTHAAAMSGVTTLALLSATNHPNQWAPLGVDASFLSLDVPCRECHILFLSDCANGFRCMMELTPELVLERAVELIEQSAARSARPQSFERRG